MSSNMRVLHARFVTRVCVSKREHLHASAVRKGQAVTVNAEGAGGDASVRLLPQFHKQREQSCTHRRGEACDHGKLCALACMHTSLRSPKHKGKAV